MTSAAALSGRYIAPYEIRTTWQLEPSSDQAFFNPKGFVTDSMPEVDASQELLRTQKEAKVRNREDQIKRGSSD
jgi:hypothetical protein